MPAAERQLFQTMLYGALTGLLAGVVVLAFRWVIEAGQEAFLPGGQAGNYEQLPLAARFLLPLIGGLGLGLVFARLPKPLRGVGIVHVLAHLRRRGGGRLPLRNAVVQFLGGIAAVVMGQSVDREGPGVHLGAAGGSFLAQRFGLSTDDDYTLIACGAAASIAAAFNTPLAGAIFVVEVLQVRYRIDRFMPVILAAVIGAVVSRAVHGDAPSFALPHLRLQSLAELPLLAVLGLACGLLASGFVFLCQAVARRTADWSPVVGFTLAGLVTGSLGLAVPQILGISYDTLDAMLNGRAAFPLVLGILTAKLVATGISIGLKLPGGLIGPTLVIGAAAGSSWGFVLSDGLGMSHSGPGFYAVMGMLAVMGAALQAPLAALIALLELTANTQILLPGMLAIASADLIARMTLGQDSVFVGLLRLGDPPGRERRDEAAADDDRTA
jgi:CIC family chloride channel protein